MGPGAKTALIIVTGMATGMAFQLAGGGILPGVLAVGVEVAIVYMIVKS